MHGQSLCEAGQFDRSRKLGLGPQPSIDPGEHPEVTRPEWPDCGSDCGQHTTRAQHTRDVLAKALAACAPARLKPVGYGVFRM